MVWMLLGHTHSAHRSETLSCPQKYLAFKDLCGRNPKSSSFCFLGIGWGQSCFCLTGLGHGFANLFLLFFYRFYQLNPGLEEVNKEHVLTGITMKFRVRDKGMENMEEEEKEEDMEEGEEEEEKEVDEVKEEEEKEVDQVKKKQRVSE